MIVDVLRNRGEIEPIIGAGIIWIPQLAKAQTEKILG